MVHNLQYADVETRLDALGANGGQEFWLAVRGNLQKLGDIRQWYEIVVGNITTEFSAEDRLFYTHAGDLLPEEPWDEGTWKSWTKAVAAKTDRKGRALFMPLRQALTGMDHGPDLAALLPLIGREKTLRRLS